MFKIKNLIIALSIVMFAFMGVSCDGNNRVPAANVPDEVFTKVIEPIHTNSDPRFYCEYDNNNVYEIAFYSNKEFSLIHLQKDVLTNEWSRKDYSFGPESINVDAGIYKTAVETDSDGKKYQKSYTIMQIKNKKGTVQDPGMNALVNLFEGYFTTDRNVTEDKCFMLVDLSCVSDENPKLSGITAMSWKADNDCSLLNEFIGSVNNTGDLIGPNYVE